MRLLDNAKLVGHLVGLERRVARGGRESIDHGPGGHNDLANAAAGAVSLVLGKKRGVGWSDLYPAWTPEERARYQGGAAAPRDRGLMGGGSLVAEVLGAPSRRGIRG